MRTAVVSNVTQKNLRQAITECVDKGATLNTDDSGVYRKQFPDYARHDIVNHSALEYSRNNPDGTKSGVNHCESFFSLLKRGVVGSWHHVSREHLPKYASEFEFRWNTRKLDDGERVSRAIKQVDGKRLDYRTSVDNPPYLVPEWEWRVKAVQAEAPIDYNKYMPKREE